MAEFSKEQWVDKIQKLIERAERAGSQEEAESCYAKAQALMTKWAIDEAMLSAAGKSDDEIVREHMTLKRSGLFPVMVQMMVSAADPNGVKLLVFSPSRFKEYAGVDLIGWKSDIDKTQMLYTSLWLQCTREGNRQTPDYVKAAGGSTLGRWRHSFKLAYAHRVGERLLAEFKKTERKAEETGAPGTVVAIYDRHQAVEDFFEGIPTKKSRASRTKLDYDGMVAGRVAAERADIGHQRIGGHKELNS